MTSYCLQAIDGGRIVSNMIREPVHDFAKRMEAVLRRNDHKGGWADMPLQALLSRLREETHELAGYIDCIERDETYDDIYMEAADEAVDVANFAMMIADVALRLRPAAPPAPPAVEPSLTPAPQGLMGAVEAGRQPANDPDLVVVRAVAPVPPFADADGSSHVLQPGDLVTVSRGIADLLVRRQKAVLVEVAA